jgi:hypothetical protein
MKRQSAAFLFMPRGWITTARWIGAPHSIVFEKAARLEPNRVEMNPDSSSTPSDVMIDRTRYPWIIRRNPVRDGVYVDEEQVVVMNRVTCLLILFLIHLAVALADLSDSYGMDKVGELQGRAERLL